MIESSWKGWLVCLTAALFFFYIFTQMLLFNVIGHSVMTELSLTNTGMGSLSSAYFWGNVFFLFPAGVILDHFSAKKILSIAMIVTISSLLVFSMASDFTVLFISRLLIGVMGAFALITGLTLASRWFPPTKMALVSGSIITVGFLGGLVSQTPLTLLNNALGWRHTMQWSVGLGCFLLILMLLFIQDYPKNYSQNTEPSKTPRPSLWPSIKKAAGNTQNWLFGLYVCFINLPIFILGGAFGIGYLSQAKNLSNTHASLATSMLLIGAMIGSPVLGWVSDKAGSRKPTMIAGSILSLLLILIIMYVSPLSLTSLILLFFGLGFITSTQVIGYPAISESNPPEIIGTSLSIGSTLIMAGGLLIPIFGWLLDLHGVHGETHLATDYSIAMSMIPIAFVLSLICVGLAKETHCRTTLQK